MTCVWSIKRADLAVAPFRRLRSNLDVGLEIRFLFAILVFPVFGGPGSRSCLLARILRSLFPMMSCP